MYIIGLDLYNGGIKIQGLFYDLSWARLFTLYTCHAKPTKYEFVLFRLINLDLCSANNFGALRVFALCPRKI